MELKVRKITSRIWCSWICISACLRTPFLQSSLSQNGHSNQEHRNAFNISAHNFEVGFNIRLMIRYSLDGCFCIIFFKTFFASVLLPFIWCRPSSYSSAKSDDLGLSLHLRLLVPDLRQTFVHHVASGFPLPVFCVRDSRAVLRRHTRLL